MYDYRMTESEYRFMKIIWENGDISSSALVEKCKTILDWKKSTTYTIIKRMAEKGFLKNENGTVTALVKREQVEKYQSHRIVNSTFDGSLPKFIAAFMEDKKLTKEQAEQLKQLIDSYSEK